MDSYSAPGPGNISFLSFGAPSFTGWSGRCCLMGSHCNTVGDGDQLNSLLQNIGVGLKLSFISPCLASVHWSWLATLLQN